MEIFSGESHGGFITKNIAVSAKYRVPDETPVSISKRIKKSKLSKIH